MANKQTVAEKKSVDVVYLDEWMPKNLKAIKEKSGLTVLDPTGGLGCGAFGCVYLTDDPRWVVKVTRDKDEGPMALKITELRAEIAGGSGFGPSKALQGIVFFKNIFQARPVEHHRKIFRPYVIIRENVQPVEEPYVRDVMQWYIDPKISTEYSHTALNLAYKYARKFDDHKNEPKKLKQAILKYVDWLKVAREEFPYVGQDMLDLMDHDMVLQDVHQYNIGFTTVDWGSKYREKGSAVIYDLGMTPTMPKSKFAQLNPLHITQL